MNEQYREAIKKMLENIQADAKEIFEARAPKKVLLIAREYVISDYMRAVSKAYQEAFGDNNHNESSTYYWAKAYQEGYMFDFMGVNSDEVLSIALVPTGNFDKLYLTI